jgi:hypothetical protein
VTFKEDIDQDFEKDFDFNAESLKKAIEDHEREEKAKL